MSIAYVNEEFVPLAEARVSPLDRGYLFGDGVYEVVPAYGGRLFRLDEHLVRLERSLAAIRIENPHTRAGWTDLLGDLVDRNDGGDQFVYLQVTRGVAPRNHPFPDGVTPCVFAMSKPAAPAAAPTPATAVVREDFRWGRCDIKSISLLGNVLLRQEAVDAGAREAILLRDGHVTEGAASNVFVVVGDRIVTPPKSTEILAGITRDVVIEIARAAQLPVIEGVVSEADLRGAAEVWVTSSTMEVTPVVELDGQPVGNGRPGPKWSRVHDLFVEHKKRSIAAAS